MLSLHTGYDVSYLTKAVGTGATATDYYTGAKGEPPGYWQGARVRGAVKRANARRVAVAGREAAYARTGHHSATSGEYGDAEGFIAGSFEQSDAREGAPQLHVHNAIANRARRLDGADDKW